MFRWRRFWLSTGWLLLKIVAILLLMHGSRASFVYQNF
jgi:hypothetical protein